MGKRLVIVGGGHAHLTALLRLGTYVERGHEATLISPSPYHYYSGMGPGLLSGIYRPQEARFHIKRMVEERGGRFIRDKVIRIEARRRLLFLESGSTLEYDVVSFNTGSEVPTGSLVVGKDRVLTVKPIIHLLEARRVLLEELRARTMDVTVVGGGPAGVEVAANLWRLVAKSGGRARITLVAGSALLKGHPERVRSLAMRSLMKRGIEVIEGVHVREIDGDLLLTDGIRLSADLAVLALGIRPSSLFRDSEIPTGKDGGLLVNGYLQSVAYPEIFGGGDCICLEGRPLKRVGVYAVRQNETLYHNLKAALQGGEMECFDPGGDFLLIMNMGDGRGILWKKGFVLSGRLAFMLKDYIDRRFMRKFQVSGELREEREQ